MHASKAIHEAPLPSVVTMYNERAVGRPWASGDATSQAQDDDLSTAKRET